MSVLDRVWARNHPSEPLPIEWKPRPVEVAYPRDLDANVRVMAAEEFAHKARPLRTVEIVHGELKANTEALARTLTLARDLVALDDKLHVELAALIAAGKAEFRAKLTELEEVEKETGVGAKVGATATVEETA